MEHDAVMAAAHQLQCDAALVVQQEYNAAQQVHSNAAMAQALAMELAAEDGQSIAAPHPVHDGAKRKALKNNEKGQKR